MITSYRKAVLRFTPERARWVSREVWHPQQRGEFDNEGNYILSFPYSNDIELVMDILRYAPDVEVIKPQELRKRVQQQLEKALSQYK